MRVMVLVLLACLLLLLIAAAAAAAACHLLLLLDAAHACCSWCRPTTGACWCLLLAGDSCWWCWCLIAFAAAVCWIGFCCLKLILMLASAADLDQKLLQESLCVQARQVFSRNVSFNSKTPLRL
jgi:hypothetical protein